MQPQEIKEILKLLIEKAFTIDPNLAIRLNQINLWIKGVKPGSLMAKPFVMLFLQQIIRDADAWLKLKSLSSDLSSM
ncbi:hypothetical protein H6G54_18625 [Anabaena cylindrica FACHB-243]|uniref:hypothetical protein n=1 Tax=Anabaena TaxID=1163 RepID=UPI00030A5026|nr:MULTISPECIES: hypothetical protein [Anabaena]MBD2419683.1 hypothetical protein [Anabaena cylindrica FACHB-243]MBY5281614.1 hypothetical protein [Anabaena sp. CCAP 1446/1C]MBY5307133.1 hypothetical protein [Anabaena sp. CCAP 1446/1C]MCM2409203.1 hypothetical protein [Anabaena sp. CCAP 1446/1C]